VGDFADDHDLFKIADATDPRSFVGGREPGWKSVPPERRLARTQKHSVVRHQGDQAGKIPGIDCVNPLCMNLTDGAFIRSHLHSAVATA
jgi:hypothetical protein